MDTHIEHLQSLYNDMEKVLQTSIGNPISVQSKIQKAFKALENGKQEFNRYISKEYDNLGDTDIALTLYTKYPSYLDEAFLIKLENSKIISPYSKNYDSKDLAEKLYNIYVKKDKTKTKLDDILEQIVQLNQLENYDIKKDTFFPLTPMQKVLRNFMNAETPYKGLLLIHGTGVGKTCTGIQIAENLKDMVVKMKTKIYVIRFEEFKRQIFENRKLRKGENVVLQCTSDTYIREISDSSVNKDNILECKNGDEEKCLKVEKTINKQINKYYDGYNTPYQWARMIQKMIKSRTRNLSGIEKHQKIIKIIRQKFNNALLIIDEAHNLRNIGNTITKDKGGKNIDNNPNNIKELNDLIEQDEIEDSKDAENVNFITKMIQNVLLYSQNMRLILLSATPMYDKPQDIIPLLNFLRMNDKKPNIKNSDIFDKDGKITKSGEEKLKKSSVGYISYVRGNDPIEFPIRLEADMNIPNKIIDLKSYPDKDILGKTILKKDKIKYMKLVKCPLNVSHQNALLSIIGLSEKNNTNTKNTKNDIVNKGKTKSIEPLVKEDYSTQEFIMENEEIIEKNFSVAYNTEIQMSNFMYQTLKESKGQSQFCYGEKGFNAITKKIPKKYSFKFEDEDMGKRFIGEGLKKHGPKLYECIQNIEKSDGPVFVYTYYTFGGVLPMAFALEMLGYTRYGGITPLLENKHKSIKKKGEYIIYTGDTQLRKGASKFFNLRQNMTKNNSVKVVIASKKGSEGLNLFGFREIHILDPWHNINLLEQTIGRVIRRRSHDSLPPEKRNVVVYMYSTVMSGDKKNMESIDMRVYRICEKKALLSLDVLNILKRNAIDCQLTKAINYRDKKDYKNNIKCITSHNKEIEYNPADNNINKLYSITDYTCFVEEYKNKLGASKLKKIEKQSEIYSKNINKTLLYFDIEMRDILNIFRNLLIKSYNLHRVDCIDIITDILPENEKGNKELINNIYDVVINTLENELVKLQYKVNNEYIFGKIIKVNLPNNDEVLRISPYYNQNPDISFYQQYYEYMIYLSKYWYETQTKIIRKQKLMKTKNPYVFKNINKINLNELIKDLDKEKLKFTSSQNLNYKNILLNIQKNADNILYKIKDNKNLSSLKTSDNLSEKIDKLDIDINIQTNININLNYGFNELYKYLFDKLLINEKSFLLQNLIFRLKTKQKLTFTEKIILNIINFSLVNKNEFISSLDDITKIKSNYYIDYNRNYKTLYGYIIADFNNLYLYRFKEEELKNIDLKQSNNIDVKNFFVVDKIKLKSLLSKRWKYMSKQNLNNIYCHNAYKKSTYLPPEFKITDYAGKGYKKSVKGVSCNSNKLGQIIRYINKLSPNYKIKKVKNRKKICVDLELLARIKHNEENPDLTQAGITIYFLSPEEYYIWNYHQQ